jgi:hypothetical protein
VSTPQQTPLCPHCGAPHGPDQEYCLECGHRLKPAPGAFGRLSSAWQRRFGWYPGDWVWPVLLGFLVAVAGATAAIVLADAGAENGPIVATQGGPAHLPTTTPTATVALPRVPTGTPSGSGPPSTPSTPPPATTTGPRPGVLTSWPAGRNGFTVVLESVPAGGSGRALAVSRARSASTSGLPSVGVLDSSRFSSLHPGYYVVFSGIYTSDAQAERALAAAAAKGFQAAYVRQITR